MLHWTNFGCHALTTSATTHCVHVVWLLIDVAKQYDHCPTQQLTRPIEILWISTAQAGFTHQQNRNLSVPQGVGPGDTSRAGVRRQVTCDLCLPLSDL